MWFQGELTANNDMYTTICAEWIMNETIWEVMWIHVRSNVSLLLKADVT